MTGGDNLLTCYNKGCGKKFDPNVEGKLSIELSKL
jgi:hypothetical protein